MTDDKRAGHELFDMEPIFYSFAARIDSGLEVFDKSFRFILSLT